jgi:hypothetical protein
VTGNCAGAGPIGGLRIDRRAPRVAIAAPLDGAEVEIGSRLIAAFSCADGGSGVALCAGSANDGAALDTATAGAHLFTVDSVDTVGNETVATATYWVRYRWLGWDPPIGRGSGTDEAGRTIPVKFSVAGAGAAALVGRVQSANVPCQGAAPVASADPRLEPADVAVSETGRDGHGMLLWRTSGGFAGSCRQLLLQLTDGSVHRLTFEFKADPRRRG